MENLLMTNHKDNTGELPHGWEYVKLGDVCEKMSNGANVKQFEEPIGFPISRIETIWNETIDLNRVKYIYENDPEFVKKYALQPGDILFSHINSDSHLGKTAIFRKHSNSLIHGINLLLIRLDKLKVDPAFFQYQFNYKRKQGVFISIAQKAVNQSSINQPKLKNLDFVLPPLKTQKSIVSKIEELFSELDKGIESLKRAQQQLKVYRQAVLKWAFDGRLTNENVKEGEMPEGWRTATIGEIGKVKGGKRLPKGHYYSEIPTKHVYIRVTDFDNQSINQSKLKFLYPSTQIAIKNYTISKEDVYISIAGTIGVTGIIPPSLDGANLTENAAKITELKGIENKFLSLFLLSVKGQSQIKVNTKTTTQPKLSLFRIETIEIPIPKISEQIIIMQTIENRLSISDKLEETINQSLQQAEVLRQSILKMAFEGN